MSVRLIAVDLDGTLLDASGRVHESDRRALQAAAREGVVVSIITGRLYSGSARAAHAIGADGPVACVEGAHLVWGTSGVEISHDEIPRAVAARARELFRGSTSACFAFAHDEIVHDETGAPFLPYVTAWSERVTTARHTCDHPHWDHERGLSAVVAVGVEGEIREAAAELERAGGAFVVSFPIARVPGDLWGMMVRSAGTDKGVALAALAAHHGLTVDDCAVVGDWLNDVPMFQVAGHSFAMGQAPDDVARHAKTRLTATSATGGGVAEALARLGIT
ncbi:MAG: HAD family phosphatase [Polyangiaceae bacterium]|nr:HAD family phosphatase [Polyangiaceae bacterium]